MDGKYSKEEIRRIAEDMVEDLKGCEDGMVTTTNRMSLAYGHTDMDVSDLFELHYALLKTAEMHNIELDMSEHNDKDEGLPFDLTFVVRKRSSAPEKHDADR